MNQGILGLPMIKARQAVSNILAADVTMTTGGVFYDGPQVIVIPGTWLLIGKVTARPSPAGSTTYTSKLWDGTTTGILDSTEMVSAGTNFPCEMTHTAVVTVTATTTFKISVTNAGNGGAIKASTPFLGVAGASSLVAIPID